MPEPTTYGFSKTSFDPTTLPVFDTELIDKADIDEFAKALNSVVPSQSGREVVPVISGTLYRIRHLSGWPGCFS